jgi:exodeoxyribonuclease V alpha subunit
MARKCLSLLKEALDEIALAVEGEVIVKAILPPMQALLNAAPNSSLIDGGRYRPIASVGPSQVLADVISSGAASVVRLTKVFRQAALSRVISNAHRINHGAMPDLSPRQRLLFRSR